MTTQTVSRRGCATDTLNTIEGISGDDQQIIDMSAEYIALADVYDADWKAYCAADPDDKNVATDRFDAENDCRGDRLDEIEDAVADMVPTTISGFAAKAAVGMRVLTIHHAFEDGSFCGSLAIVTNLCRDLIAAENNPDAELIDLCQQYCDLAHKSWLLHCGPDRIEDDDECEQADAPYQRKMDKLIKKVRPLRASTLDGYLARARTIASNGSMLPDDYQRLVPSKFRNETLLGQLLRDLIEQSGWLPHGCAVEVSEPKQEDDASRVDDVEPGNPDASLIKLCAEHIANYRAFNAYEGDLDADDNPLWDAYLRTERAIRDAKPQTMAGLAAKARVIKVEGTHPDGMEDPEGEAFQMWDLVNDLIRLGDEPDPPTSSPDTHLLEIVDEFFSLKAEGDAKYEALYESDAPGSEEEKAAFKEWDDKRYNRMVDIEEEAQKIGPTTPEGFAAKARLVEHDLLRSHGVDGQPDGSVVLAISLCQDLVGKVAV